MIHIKLKKSHRKQDQEHHFLKKSLYFHVFPWSCTTYLGMQIAGHPHSILVGLHNVILGDVGTWKGMSHLQMSPLCLYESTNRLNKIMALHSLPVKTGSFTWFSV